MSENEQTYMIDVSGQITGPHTIGNLIRLREQSRLPDSAKVIYPGESWSDATELRNSPKLLIKLHQLRKESNIAVELPSVAAAQVTENPMASNYQPIQSVVITDIRMPFDSMVIFMVKWAIASVPAAIILVIIVAILWAMLGALGLAS